MWNLQALIDFAKFNPTGNFIDIAVCAAIHTSTTKRASADLPYVQDRNWTFDNTFEEWNLGLALEPISPSTHCYEMGLLSMVKVD